MKEFLVTSLASLPDPLALAAYVGEQVFRKQAGDLQC